VLSGFRVEGDIKRLRESYPSAPHYHSVSGLREISLSRGTGTATGDGGSGGLDALCREALGLRLDKRMQRSDWEMRPLSAEQTEYAALDALVLVEIWRRG
jgi:hypothetical protein